MLCLLASAVAFVFYIGTGKDGYRRWGWVILKWTLVAAFMFFAVLLMERL